MKTTLILALLVATAPLAHATVTDPLQDDAGSGRDAGDAPRKATPMGPGDHRGMVVLVDDPADWYALGLAEGALNKVRVDASSVGCGLPDAPVASTPFAVTLRSADGSERVTQTFPSPCGASVTFDVPPHADGWLLGIEIGPVDDAVGGGLPGTHKTGGPPTPEAEYFVLVACQPFC